MIGGDISNIIMIGPSSTDIDVYQTPHIQQMQYLPLTVGEVDPMKDLLTLVTDKEVVRAQSWNAPYAQIKPSIPYIRSLDEVNVGDTLNIYGFPHCGDGRNVLTYQDSKLGAKVYLEASGIKFKHGVVNFQSRPGQSGSPVLDVDGSVVAMIIGTYTPGGGGISIMGINPASLNQTTHIISAEYIQGLL